MFHPCIYRTCTSIDPKTHPNGGKNRRHINTYGHMVYTLGFHDPGTSCHCSFSQIIIRMAREQTFCDKLHASRPCSPWCPHGSGEVTSAPGEDEKLMGIKDIEADLNNDTSNKKNNVLCGKYNTYIYICIGVYIHKIIYYK